MITAQELINDAYASCQTVLDANNASSPASLLFEQAAERICSFEIYGQNKPDSEVVLLDVWDFFTEQEKSLLEEENHPYWQAVQELSAE